MDIVIEAYNDYVKNEPYMRYEKEAYGEYNGRKVKVELKYDRYALFFKWKVLCAVYGDKIGDTQLSTVSFRKYEKAYSYFIYIVKKYGLEIKYEE